MIIFKKKDILIIGTIPPPLGGVTIHVQRLLSGLNNQNDLKFDFLDYKRTSIFKIISKFVGYKVIHIHISNPFIRFIFSIIAKLLFCKVILTFHGNLGRHSDFKNWIDRMTIRIIDCPIILNEESLVISQNINKNSIKLSAFLPPQSIEILTEDYLNIVEDLKRNFGYVFAMNCSNYTLDNNGNDVYQVENIINCFKDIKNASIVISDPKDVYRPRFEEIIRKDNISNVKFLSKPHSFFALLNMVDCFLRYTTTDGDSLSIHEALYQNTPVIATNIVTRPQGVIEINLSKDKLKKYIANPELIELKEYKTTNVLEELVKIYNKLIV